MFFSLCVCMPTCVCTCELVVLESSSFFLLMGKLKILYPYIISGPFQRTPGFLITFTQILKLSITIIKIVPHIFFSYSLSYSLSQSHLFALVFGRNQSQESYLTIRTICYVQHSSVLNFSQNF